MNVGEMLWQKTTELYELVIVKGIDTYAMYNLALLLKRGSGVQDLNLTQVLGLLEIEGNNDTGCIE